MTASVRFCSTTTGGEWVAAEGQPAQADEPAIKGAREEIEAFLLDCMTSHNLLVLTGLGTSLSINTLNESSDGQKPAPTMSDLWAAAKTQMGGDFDEVLHSVYYNPSPGQESIETLLSKCKMALELWSGQSAKQDLITRFVSISEGIIKDKCDFITSDTILRSHELLIQRIGRRSSRKPRTKIFTVNYDRCFEEAAKRLRFVVIDGFSHTVPQVYDVSHFSYDIVRRDKGGDAPDYIENVFQFYKLHGSLDWTLEAGEVVKREGAEQPLLIYPRSSKYEQAFEPPYLDMMSAFQTSLRQPDTAVIVVGFGFNDEHVAQPIMGALQANLSLRLLVCDPHFRTQPDGHAEANTGAGPANKYHSQLLRLIRSGDVRIGLLQSTFESLVQYIPDLVAESDRERHAQRFRDLRRLEGVLE